MIRIYALFLLIVAGGSYPLRAQYPESDLGDYGGYAYSDKRIQIALLLDVSGSMEGLIEQAKSQLWYIVNGIMYDYGYDHPPRLELALYEYGSRHLGERGRYLRQVVPFTTDLDWLSSELFRLKVDGRHEYCGAVLESALYHLDWSRDPDDLRLIYIAGNESFGQGPVSARRALDEANRKGITVHSIYCGESYQGRREGWEEAAYLGGGEFFTIDQNAHDYYEGDPYDRRLLGLNRRLNQTYLPYGSQAMVYAQRQQQTDQHAQAYGQGIASQRVIAKASPAYIQPQWDLVDAVATGQVDLHTLPAAQLPAEMRSMSLKQQQTYLKQKAQERKQLRQEIHQIAAVKPPKGKAPSAPVRPGREQTLSSPGRTSPSAGNPKPSKATLGDAILKATQQPGGARGYSRPAPASRILERSIEQSRPQPQPSGSRPTPASTPSATPPARSIPRPTTPTYRPPSIQHTPSPSRPSQMRTPQPRRPSTAQPSPSPSPSRATPRPSQRQIPRSKPSLTRPAARPSPKPNSQASPSLTPRKQH